MPYLIVFTMISLVLYAIMAEMLRKINEIRMFFKIPHQKNGYGESAFTVNYNTNLISTTTFLNWNLEKSTFSIDFPMQFIQNHMQNQRYHYENNIIWHLITTFTSFTYFTSFTTFSEAYSWTLIRSLEALIRSLQEKR